MSSSSAPGRPGLTAAYQLVKAGKRSTVLEADGVVGGISRTVERDGWRFDIGGHRFFTKVRPVEELWHEILPDDDFLLRPRMSRILLPRASIYDYPLKAIERPAQPGGRRGGPLRALLRLGPDPAAQGPDNVRGLAGGAVRMAALPALLQDLHREGVGASRPSEMPADWAAQRIKNLSLSSAIVNAVLPKRNQKDITSLIEEFEYPKLRARDDVGALPRTGRGGRHEGRGRHRGRRRSASGAAGP